MAPIGFLNRLREGSSEQSQRGAAGRAVVLLWMVDDDEVARWEGRAHGNNRQAACGKILRNRQTRHHRDAQSRHHGALRGVWMIEGHRAGGRESMAVPPRNELA